MRFNKWGLINVANKIFIKIEFDFLIYIIEIFNINQNELSHSF
jgi:hypothetical protein